jgi:hypothetical protein
MVAARRLERTATRAAEFGPAIPSPQAELHDFRFRLLLGEERWGALPEAVRARFSKRYSEGRTVAYAGLVDRITISRAGFVVSHLVRLLGGPLPISRDTGVPTVVAVTEDLRGGGQVWSRLFARRNGFPQVIHSAKRFSGPTGLEEVVGLGIGMALEVGVTPTGITFRSAGYFWQVLGRRIPVPAPLTPGDLVVEHADGGNGTFTFTLRLVHPFLGELVHQVASYREAVR